MTDRGYPQNPFPKGLIIAAPASGSGKTVLTLGLLRQLSRNGISVGSIKTGPDYIDPVFHARATKRPCYNLDPWAMRQQTVAGLISQTARETDFILGEGVMGLFDGATHLEGSTADLAALTGWPVVLILDVRSQAASAAAVVKGFAELRSDITIAGVIFNRIGSPRHEKLLRQAMGHFLPSVKILGAIPWNQSLSLPDRHLGLVQASEHQNLEQFLESAADVVADHIDWQALVDIADGHQKSLLANKAHPLKPLGQRIAIARDEAFAFAYPATLEGWQAQGAELCFFSPLADEAPDREADAVYLPGGYPELHADRIAASTHFIAGLQQKAAGGCALFGECGGYMVLGETLTDKQGTPHKMAGLLPVETSFAKRKLHLGYRAIKQLVRTSLGPVNHTYRGHEFHYATETIIGPSSPLFEARDAQGNDLGPVGLVKDNVAASFIHLIDAGDNG